MRDDATVRVAASVPRPRLPYEWAGLRVIRTRGQLGSLQAAASELGELLVWWWWCAPRGCPNQGGPVDNIQSLVCREQKASCVCHPAGLSPLMLLANANRSCAMGETSGQVSWFQDGGYRFWVQTKRWNSAVHEMRTTSEASPIFGAWCCALLLMVISSPR